MTYFLGHQSDVWLAVGQHALISLVSLLIALAIAIPLGVLAARAPAVGAPILGLLGAIYTIPSMALLGVLVLVEGLGFWTAVTALAAYAQMILVRNVAAGIAGVDRGVVEAARGLGMGAWQVFWRIERPLATPVFIAGVRVATVSIVGIASVAAWVGAGGLGTLIFAGIDQGNDAKAVTGAIAAMLLALAADGSLRALERRFVASR
ncbi:MAG: ABC transporter permease [Candidatus Eremiobacterales bacterium]|jgi:osmoprotectant transport system permease protein